MPRGVYERKPGMGNHGKTRAMRDSILRRRANGLSIPDIALRFGLSVWTVSRVLNDRDWNSYRRKPPVTDTPVVIRSHDFQTKDV